MSKSDWMKGLQQAEKEYLMYTSRASLISANDITDDSLHDFAIKHMSMDIDIEYSHGSKDRQWCGGYSDFIWQKDYNRFDRGIK